MTGTSWADVVAEGSGLIPPRPAGREVPVGSPEVRDAAVLLKAAEAEFKAFPSSLDPEYDEAQYKAKQKARDDAQQAYNQVQSASRANAEAARAAAAATPAAVVPPQPAFTEGRNTHELARQGDARSRYDAVQDVLEMLPGLVATEVAKSFAAAARAPAPVASEANGTISGKHPPAPPKYSGDKGDGRVSINAWLLHFVEWCTLYSVPAHRRVAYAILALEGAAVETWYSRKQQLELEGKDPYDWDTFRSDMISKYADVSPDLFVRSKLATLKQGSGSVQAYYDKYRAIISQADSHPVRGAEAIWFFKQGLHDSIRKVIAIYGDDDLDTVVLQAKRVDAAHRLESNTSSAAPSSSKKYTSAAGTKRSGANTGGDPKRPKHNLDRDLVNYRVKVLKICSVCRVPAAQHDPNTIGRECPTTAVPATPEELAYLKKGKAKA